jgi:hypothetical protein
MEPETVLQAVLSIWPELPALLGPSWPALRGRIAAIANSLQAARDSAERYSLVADLILAFRDHGPARRRLQEAIQKTSQERGLTFRSPTSPQPPAARQPPFRSLLARLGLVASRQPEAEPVSPYPEIDCPRRVSVREETVTVTVRLKAAPPAAGDRPLRPVAPGRQITVTIHAPDFELRGPRTQSLVVGADGNSDPVVYRLKPRWVCETRINFDFMAGTQALGSRSVQVEVTETPTPAEMPAATADRSPPLLLSGVAGADPDITLRIVYEQVQGAHTLRFGLVRTGQEDRWFTHVPLGTNPMARASALFQRLVVLRQGYDPGAKVVLGKRLTLTEDDIDQQLKSIGQNMWRDLVPEDFKELYAATRGDWKDRSLLIQSDEPFFPWELLWPYQAAARKEDRWEDEQPWCLTLKLARWLGKDGRGNGLPNGAPGSLSLRAVVCLVPTDSGLPAALEEKEFFRALMEDKKWVDLSPSEATRAAVRDVLSEGGYDWFHAAAHGSFYPQGENADSALWLENNLPLGPEEIVGKIENWILEQRPAFIFNACHAGRLGWVLNRLDGWAHRLLSSGAGMFLAPLWTVTDALATEFARAFYRQLLKGQPVGEAVREGRRAARRDGDPSWLAYSLYANPNARLAAPDGPAAG